MNRRPLLVVAVLVATLAGCASQPSRLDPPRTPAVNDIAKLEAAGRHTDVIDRVDRELATRPDAATRVRLELLRAQAYQALGRTRSAQIAWQRAFEALPRDTGPLAREALVAWGDGELRMGRHDEAVHRYAQALDTGYVPPKERDDINARGYLALREAGRWSEAKTWRGRMSLYSSAAIEDLERRLLPPKPHVAESAPSRPAPVARSSGFPDDPREILPEIHRRVEWGAAPVRANVDPMLPVRRITVHHSAMVSHATQAATVGGEIRQIQSNHQNGNKWADIGYHFLIDAGGGIWEARPLRYQGAHEGAGLNQGAIGVCLLGNFQQQPLPASQRDALARLLDALETRYGLTRKDVATHREVRKDPTECPGSSLQAWVDGYRRSGPPLAAR